MPEPNELLRTAREQVESPSCPGEPMTRQELAEAVNAQVYRATEKVTAVDANHVGKWEMRKDPVAGRALPRRASRRVGRRHGRRVGVSACRWSSWYL